MDKLPYFGILLAVIASIVVGLVTKPNLAKKAFDLLFDLVFTVALSFLIALVVTRVIEGQSDMIRLILLTVINSVTVFLTGITSRLLRKNFKK